METWYYNICVITAFPPTDRRNQLRSSIKATGLQGKIRTWDLPSKKQERQTLHCNVMYQDNWAYQWSQTVTTRFTDNSLNREINLNNM
jgi:hypothetical protein